MIPSPMPAYFLIRIPRKQQKDKREKIGSIFIPFNHVHMTREFQSGEIVSIGHDAHVDFPQAKIGHELIVHHFVSGKETENEDGGRYHIYTDENYNYYTVTSSSFNGRANECYGIYDGEKIITHPEYIFLEVEKPPTDDFPDGLTNMPTMKTKSGLFLFKKWGLTRKEITEKNKVIKERINSLANIGAMTDEIRFEIEKLEGEMTENSKQGNKREYRPYVIAASNQIINDWFGYQIKNGDVVYCLNIAAETTIEHLGKQYRVVKIGYISFPHAYLRKAIDKFESKSGRCFQSA